VVAIGTSPNGTNINDKCGSTHPQAMCDKVVDTGADIGIALDGDADRLIICDQNGKIVDGDQLMAAIATYWHENDRLKGGAVVATIMSNLGLEKYIESLGLKLERTAVGDRYVVAAMQEMGCNIGGEQSGHIVLCDFNTTGDGLVAALQVLAIMVEKTGAASELFNLFDPYPQLLKNVKYNENANPLEVASVKQAISDGEISLNGSGRIVIRKSGTEPLIRVMVEGKDGGLIENVANDIVASVKECCS
jgi:phosphoglucosamine mutase